MQVVWRLLLIHPIWVEVWKVGAIDRAAAGVHHARPALLRQPEDIPRAEHVVRVILRERGGGFRETRVAAVRREMEHDVCLDAREQPHVEVARRVGAHV